MPISAEQWRGAVGNNNAASSHVLRKCIRKKYPKSLLSLFLSLLVALFAPGVGLVDNRVSCDARIVSCACESRGGPAPKGNQRQYWQSLCVAFSITVLAVLLCCSGDVETNPGPLFDLVPGNLCEVRRLLREASPYWSDLGLELGIDQTKLKIIEKDNQKTTECFTEMLSEWLNMVDPRPSWEGLIAALKEPYINRAELAGKLEIMQQDDFDETRVKRAKKESTEQQEQKVHRDLLAYLKELYSENERKNLAPFKLARIEKKMENSERNCDDFTKSTLRGDQDDVIYTKEHMEENEIGILTYSTGNKQPRLVLIEGAAGVGKTTFSEQFCYKWSQGQLLSNHKLLVLLPLRDNTVRSASKVSDLFQHPDQEVQQAIAQEVESNGGEGVALWLEAWDELGEEMRNKSSLFLDLVYGHILPRATIIITSRPWATKNLREKVDQHVEIVSTPTIQYNRILRGEIIKPSTRAMFIDYVNSNPSIKAAMHTPVTANIVAEVFQWSRDTESNPPTTMTQLYTAFTCKLLMQHLSSCKEEGNMSHYIRSLDEVPAEWKERLHEICKLAWEGILEQQLTFSSNVLGGNTLGLMCEVRELYEGEASQLSYHFIHLTLQEFLSACHITQLPLDRQQQIIRANVETGHLNGVVKFYFGLSKHSQFTASMISQHLSTSKNASVFHWLFEAGDMETATEELGSQRKVRLKTSYSWSPLDYYALGYSIAHYEFQWKLICNGSSMGDEELEMLIQGMASFTETTWNGNIKCEFRSNNISLEGVKRFKTIPRQLAQQTITVNFAFNNKLDNKALISFCEDSIPVLSRLKTFSLQGISIGKSGSVKKFSKQLCYFKTPLKKLGLSQTHLDEEDCAELALLIANTDLERLHLSHNSLSIVSVASIMEGLLQNHTIQLLDMAGSHFSEDNCKSLELLLQRAECQLKELDLDACHISVSGAEHLAQALTNNRSLQRLNLKGNQFGDVGAEAFGDALRKNATLTTLHMAGCEIASKGCVQLAAGLTNNSALQELNISSNCIGVEGVQALSGMIDRNTTLKELTIWEDGSLWGGMDILVESIQNNETLEKIVLPSQYRCSGVGKRVTWS